MAKSIVEENIQFIRSHLLPLPAQLRFDFLTAEAYTNPNTLYAIIEVLLNIPLTYFRFTHERVKFQRLASFIKPYMRRTRKEKRICDVLKDLKNYNSDVFDVISFGFQRVVNFWYEPKEDRLRRRKRYFSAYNDSYECSKNVLNLINDRVPPRVKRKTLPLRLFELLDNHFGCMICYDVLLEGVETECKHRFCNTCLSTWRQQNSTCPLCRAELIEAAHEFHLNEFLNDVFDLVPKPRRVEREKRVRAAAIL